MRQGAVWVGWMKGTGYIIVNAGVRIITISRKFIKLLNLFGTKAFDTSLISTHFLFSLEMLKMISFQKEKKYRKNIIINISKNYFKAIQANMY